MKRIQIAFAARQRRALKREAAREGVSLAEILRRIVDRHIRRAEAVRSLIALGTSGGREVSSDHDRALDRALRGSGS